MGQVEKTPDYLVDVQLFTRDGVYVCTVYVPQFLIRPDILTWGTRVFPLNVERNQYREGTVCPCDRGHRFDK